MSSSCPTGVVERTPLALFGSLEQGVDQLGRLREDLGLGHVGIRDPKGFAGVVEALAGR